MQQALNPAAGLLQSHNLIFNDLHRRHTLSGRTTTIAGRRLLSRARLIVHSERPTNYPSRPSLQLLSAKMFSSLPPRVPKSNPEIRRNLLETMRLRIPKNRSCPLAEFFSNPLQTKPLRSTATPKRQGPRKGLGSDWGAHTSFRAGCYQLFPQVGVQCMCSLLDPACSRWSHARRRSVQRS